MTKTVALDRFDLALLDLVQHNNQTPARVLAESVGLSESAVLRRLRQLRSDRVIVADVALVDPAILGVTLSMHVLVSMDREGTAVLDAFSRKIRRRGEVHEAWYATGEAEFVLFVQVPTMEAYNRFAREVLNDDPSVRSFRTLMTIRRVVDPPLQRGVSDKGDLDRSGRPSIP